MASTHIEQHHLSTSRHGAWTIEPGLCSLDSLQWTADARLQYRKPWSRVWQRIHPGAPGVTDSHPGLVVQSDCRAVLLGLLGLLG